VSTLAFGAGVRAGEIKRLKLRDLHHREAQPFIQIRRVTTKTDAGSRRVALDSIGVWAVEKLLARARLIGSLEPEDYLLPTDRVRHTRSGDPWHGDAGFDPRHHQTSWEWEWDRFRKAAGISHRRFHDLRHTFVTRAAESGVPISVLQAQVGHMSVRMVDNLGDAEKSGLRAVDIDKNHREPRVYFVLAQIYEAKHDPANEATQLREYLKYASNPDDVDMVKQYLSELEKQTGK
jgi:integrase